MSYSKFAQYYDVLTRNVDYAGHADYFCTMLERLNHNAGLTLDLACGTGSLTLELAKRGIDVFGLDASPEMLSVAQQKTSSQSLDILYICQKMQQMDLYGTVDTVVCMLDGINHVTSVKDVQQTFDKISFFLNPGGCFIFDLNTVYKHKNVLGNNVFVYDMEDLYCVWQNAYEARSERVAITLDFFERSGNAYYRSSERFYERAYKTDIIKAMLEKAGLKTRAVWKEMTFETPEPNTDKIIIAAQK